MNYGEKTDHVVYAGGDSEVRPVKITGHFVAAVEYVKLSGALVKERLFLLSDGTYVVWQHNSITKEAIVAPVPEQQLRSGEKYPRLAAAAGLVEPMPLEEWLRRFQS